MFGQIIDLLVKQDDERRRIFFLFLKLMFTVTISAKLFFSIYGSYSIISITDFKSIANFLIHGTAIICFALFYFVWSLSYGMVSFLMAILGMSLSNLFYKILNTIITNPQELVTGISNDKSLQKLVRFYFWIFNTVDIVEIENNTVKPGANFYKFYDYLLDIESEEKVISSKEFSDTIALIAQFIVIYNLLGFHFITSHWWFLLATFTIIVFLIFTSVTAFALATLVDLKHGRLLTLMEKLDPKYNKPDEQQTSNDI